MKLLITSLLEAQWLERLTTAQQVMDFIPDRVSDFLFHACDMLNIPHYLFTELEIYHLS